MNSQQIVTRVSCLAKAYMLDGDSCWNPFVSWMNRDCVSHSFHTDSHNIHETGGDVTINRQRSAGTVCARHSLDIPAIHHYSRYVVGLVSGDQISKAKHMDAIIFQSWPPKRTRSSPRVVMRNLAAQRNQLSRRCALENVSGIRKGYVVNVPRSAPAHCNANASQSGGLSPKEC